MKIQHASRQVPKPGSNEDQCEDAFAFTPRTLTFAVCDGAGTAFESRRWARLLADRFAASPPPKWNRDQILGWTSQASAEWDKSIPWDELTFFEEQKAHEGSAATLVGLELVPYLNSTDTRMWQCLAIGDSCLFQVRNGQLISKLPVEHSADFGLNPPLLSTDGNANAAKLGRLAVKRGTWQEGDIFFLLTDAIAHWFLSEHEAGRAPWQFLVSSAPGEFQKFVRDAQARGQMRKDDVTVFMIGIDVQVGTPGEAMPIPVPTRLRPEDDHDFEDQVAPAPALRKRDRPGHRTQPHPKPGPVPQVKPRPMPQPPPRPEPSRPGAPHPPVPRPLSRSRAGWVVAAALALCLVIVFPFALSSGQPNPSSSPSPTASPSSPTSPSSPPSSVQTVQDAGGGFAESLVRYPRRSVDSPQGYESALKKCDASGKSDLAALSDLMPSTSSEKVTLTPLSEAIVPSSSTTSSQHEVYIVLQQRTKQHGHVIDHDFLVDLTLVHKGQTWLVNRATISAIHALKPPTTSGGKKP